MPKLELPKVDLPKPAAAEKKAPAPAPAPAPAAATPKPADKPAPPPPAPKPAEKKEAPAARKLPDFTAPKMPEFKAPAFNFTAPSFKVCVRGEICASTLTCVLLRRCSSLPAAVPDSNSGVPWAMAHGMQAPELPKPAAPAPKPAPPPAAVEMPAPKPAPAPPPPAAVKKEEAKPAEKLTSSMPKFSAPAMKVRAAGGPRCRAVRRTPPCGRPSSGWALPCVPAGARAAQAAGCSFSGLQDAGVQGGLVCMCLCVCWCVGVLSCIGVSQPPPAWPAPADAGPRRQQAGRLHSAQAALRQPGCE